MRQNASTGHYFKNRENATSATLEMEGSPVIVEIMLSVTDEYREQSYDRKKKVKGTNLGFCCNK